MSIEASLQACEETVRRADPDRYIAALFAPAERRPLLFALYAFNHEIARIGETVKEPMLAEIRLAWWREALEGARDGHPRAHDVVRALAEMFARAGPPLELFEPLLDARRQDAMAVPVADLAALEAYGEATAGTIMRIAARLLDEHEPDDAVFRHAGTAYALTGLLMTLSFQAARGRIFLPHASLDAARIARETLKPGEMRPELAPLVDEIVARALWHHHQARRMRLPSPMLPAILPAALVPLYARRTVKAKHDLLKAAPTVPLFRRQWAMLRATMRGRV